ncbi:hypothetical protein SAMN05428965_1295 [Geodermatophilus sp. DSM 45219]|nr:hypothetical protein SAMN05428965_1295 [Geodermatophilus sp. DSM 45219]
MTGIGGRIRTRRPRTPPLTAGEPTDRPAHVDPTRPTTATAAFPGGVVPGGALPTGPVPGDIPA